MVYMPEYKSGCLICGAELPYHTEMVTARCEGCCNHFETQVTCSGGHYICDSCHGLGAMDWIEAYCRNTSEPDAVKMELVS